MLSAYVSKLQEHEKGMRISEEEAELYTRKVNDLQEEVNTLKDQLTETKINSLVEDPDLRDHMDDLQWSLGVLERDNDLLKKQVKQLEVEATQIAPQIAPEPLSSIDTPKITTTLNAMLHVYLGMSLSGKTPDSKEVAAFMKDYMSIIEDLKTA
jgi:septal ring factor EnvC (AmiA/AmiB activator)